MLKTTERKLVKSLVEGVICKLILTNDSYINVKRLHGAINDYTSSNFDSILTKTLTEQELNSVMTTLFIEHKIFPDVLGQNGFVIAPNCEEAENSVYEYTRRNWKHGFFMYYTRNDASSKLNAFDNKTQNAINSVAKNYNENYADLREIFPEFAK